MHMFLHLLVLLIAELIAALLATQLKLTAPYAATLGGLFGWTACALRDLLP